MPSKTGTTPRKFNKKEYIGNFIIPLLLRWNELHGAWQQSLGGDMYKPSGTMGDPVPMNVTPEQLKRRHPYSI